MVSTLAEDETVSISRTPGETRRCHTYSVTLQGTPRFKLIDTPGFQNPAAVLQWFQSHPGPEADVVNDFLKAHAGQERFHHDMELLHPLSDQAGILYVVDASRPLREVDRQEMEILRLTGRPRMALLNCKREGSAYHEVWRDAVGRRFNIIRDFNAHHATFSERIHLLEALKVLNQEWEGPLTEVIEALREDWHHRTSESTLVLLELLRDAVHHVHHHRMSATDPMDTQKDAAIEGYRKDLRAMEQRARKNWRALYHHQTLPGGEDLSPLVGGDLFAEHVWRLLGFSRRQLTTIGAVTGGILGAGADLAAGGLTFGVLAAGGAALGAMGGWKGGPNLGAKRLPLPGGRTFASETLQVGPCRDFQLVSILVDRSLLYLSRLMNWAHGRRDHEAFQAAIRQSEGFVTHWSKEQRDLLLRWFTRHQKQRETAETDAELKELLERILMELGGRISPGPRADKGAS